MVKAVNNDRYERKFVVSELTLDEIESMVKHHPMLFFEIYYERSVNNIYFDSFDMKSYFDALAGSSDRIKVRIRWYGDLLGSIQNPVLEFKIKNGLLVRKESFSIKDFSIDNNFKYEVIKNVFKESNIPSNLKLHLMSLDPVFLSRYRRKYFLSADGDYRITVDSKMEWCQLNKIHNVFLNRTTDYFNKVLELKYSPEKDASAKEITSNFPFRMEKNSKYVNGIERLRLI